MLKVYKNTKIALNNYTSSLAFRSIILDHPLGYISIKCKKEKKNLDESLSRLFSLVFL